MNVYAIKNTETGELLEVNYGSYYKKYGNMCYKFNKKALDKYVEKHFRTKEIYKVVTYKVTKVDENSSNIRAYFVATKDTNRIITSIDGSGHKIFFNRESPQSLIDEFNKTYPYNHLCYHDKTIQKDNLYVMEMMLVEQ